MLALHLNTILQKTARINRTSSIKTVGHTTSCTQARRIVYIYDKRTYIYVYRNIQADIQSFQINAHHI